MATLSYARLELIAREMASLTRCNIALPEGLRLMAKAAGSPAMRDAYQQIALSLDRGEPLAEAFAVAKAPEEFAAAVRCAETCGGLPEVLECAIQHCRRVDYFYGKLANLVLYPVFVLGFALAILSIIAVTVAPKFWGIFQELGAELPAPTQLLFWGSRMLQGGGWLAALAVAALTLGWTCSPWFIRCMPFMLRALPFFRPLLALSDTAMLMKFLEQMLGRGLPLPLALRGASLAMWSPRLRLRLLEMARQAEQGFHVFGGLAGFAPPLLAHMLAQAEQRGDLPQACAGMAGYCETRFSMKAETQLNLLEPLLVVILGVIVGFVVISLYLPLFNLPRLIR